MSKVESYKERKTPWQLAREKKPDLDKRFLMVPPVDLDKLLSWKIDLIQPQKCVKMTFF